MGARILIVKLGAVGDVVYTMPMLNAVKFLLPDARISWIAGDSCVDLLQGHPALSHLVVVDDGQFYAASPLARLKEVAKLLRGVEKSYDLILIGHRDPAYALALRAFVRGPIYQVARSRANSLSTQVLVPPHSVHEGEAMRRLLRAGLDKLGHRDDFPWTADFSHVGEPTQNLPSPFVIVHVGGGSNVKTRFELKQWPHTSRFIVQLMNSWKHAIVLIGSPGERAEADRILGQLAGRFEASPEGSLIHDFVGKTSLRDLVGLIRSARLFIGPDSGPLHIADALGIPAVGLYGPTSTVSWGLVGASSRILSEDVECSPCYKDDGVFPPCPHAQKCMVNLSPDRVLAASLQLLSAAAPHLRGA